MRKRLFLCLCTFACCALAFAKDIKVEQAQKKAGPDAKLVYTARTDGKPDLYVFNRPQGFTIVAADDVVGNIILGYSDTGTFDYENMPPNLRWWLGEYQRQIDFLRKNNVNVNVNVNGNGNGNVNVNVNVNGNGNEKIQNSKFNIQNSKFNIQNSTFNDDNSTFNIQNSTFNDEEDTIVVAPLIKSRWDQTGPWHNRCPITSQGDTCYVGCVATAMSQLMYYWRWPLRAVGSRSSIGEPATYYDGFYDWDNMLDTYNGPVPATPAQEEAVAILCRDAGESVNMEYGPEGSGAYSENVVPALQKIFFYSPRMKMLSRDDYSRYDQRYDWDNILRGELDKGRPVYYDGAMNQYSGGHAFICDGYTVNGYFHFNWGWGGRDDGYFRSDVLDLEWTMFNYGQNIIVGVEPRETLTEGSNWYVRNSDTTVSLTLPDDGNGRYYTGDVVVPKTVTDNGVTYDVVGLDNNVFQQCDSLSSLTLPWDEAVVLPSYALNDSIMRHTRLIVPEGALDAYQHVAAWAFFNNVRDTAGDSIVWGDWQPIDTGTGTATYYYSVNPMINQGYWNIYDEDGKPMKHTYRCNLFFRDTKNVSTLRQYLYDELFFAQRLLIVSDKSTGNCRVPVMSMEMTDEKENEMWYADLPSYNTTKSFQEFPSTYDSLEYRFRLNIVYFTANGVLSTGIETLDIDDPPYVPLTATLNPDRFEDKKISVTLLWGRAVDHCRYAVIEESRSKEQVEADAHDIAAGTLKSLPIKKGDLKFRVSDPGTTYTMVFVGLDPDGNYVSHDHITYNYNEVTEIMSPTAKDTANGLQVTDAVYDLMGRKVDASYKGVVIANGKKYLVK